MLMLAQLMNQPNKIIQIVSTIELPDTNYSKFIKDQEAPTLKLKEVTILQNTSYSMDDFIENCSDNSKKCILNFQDKHMESYKDVGVYEIIITATDPSNNKTNETTTLTILAPQNSKNFYNPTFEKTIENNPKQNTIDLEIEKSSENESSIINEVLQYVNQYRKEVGLQPLQLSNKLNNVAKLRSKEMAESGIVEHIRPNGTECFSIFDEYGIKATSMGENIAYGYQTAQSVTEAWKNSQGHYENMVKSSYKYIGIGLAESNGDYFWTQLFSNTE